MKLSLLLRPAQAQVMAAALQHFLDTKTKEIATNQRVQLNEFDLLDPKHCVMHSLALLHELTAKPMAYFMNPLQTPTGIAPLQEATPTSTPSSPEIVPNACESAPQEVTDETVIDPRCSK